jgi:elongation factor G
MIEEATEWREKLLEAVSEYDDNLMRNSLTILPLLQSARSSMHSVKACLEMKLFPMVCGSSFKNKGVQTMLDLVMELMPSPLDKESITGTHPDTDEELSRKPDYKEPFCRSCVQNRN